MHETSELTTKLEGPQDQPKTKWPRTNRKQPYRMGELAADAYPQTAPKAEGDLGEALNGYKSRRSVGTSNHGKPAYWCLFCLTPVATASTTFCDRHRTKHQQARRRQRTVKASNQDVTPDRKTPVRRAPHVTLSNEQLADLTRTALVLSAKSSNVRGAFSRRSEQAQTVGEFRHTHGADLNHMFQAAQTLSDLLADLARNE